MGTLRFGRVRFFEVPSFPFDVDADVGLDRSEAGVAASASVIFDSA
jgi:hypothetical protein